MPAGSLGRGPWVVPYKISPAFLWKEGSGGLSPGHSLFEGEALETLFTKEQYTSSVYG